MTTNIHLLCASQADAVEIRITAGPAGDAPVGEAMLEVIAPRDGIPPAALDQADDSHAIRAKLDATGIPPVIRPTSNRRESLGDDKERYQHRHQVERLVNNIQQFRRVAPRYEKLKAHFLTFVIIAFIGIMLR